MTASSVFGYVAEHPFLVGVPADRARALAIHGRPVLHPVGRRLFRAGGPADRFWLLRSGAVALDFYVPGRGDVVIERVGAPGVVGWSWLLPPYCWALGGVVAEQCHAVQFDAAGVRALVEEDPAFGKELTMRFFGLLAERLQAGRRRLLELYAYPTATGDGLDPAVGLH
jgi:CRP/FNR family cyclic AMP-dependent transcriptional regulator